MQEFLVLSGVFTIEKLYWAEGIFDGLRKAQGLGRIGVLLRTSKRHNPRCDKARRKKRFGLMRVRLFFSKAKVWPY